MDAFLRFLSSKANKPASSSNSFSIGFIKEFYSGVKVGSSAILATHS